ncbi:MAG TPA: ATM1-type heavy metal exporter [Hyphomicrobiaceae bacterium MAG_BT-2024]
MSRNILLSLLAKVQTSSLILVGKNMLPYIWPKNRPDLRRRVLLAIVVLIISKIITVLAPIFYKSATDLLSKVSNGPEALKTTNIGLVVIFMIIAYGVSRVLTVVCTQIGDMLFTSVGQCAIRSLNNRTFRHLHHLSLRYHLETRLGNLSRVLERATRAVELIIRNGILNLIPTIFELFCLTIVLLFFFNWVYVFITAITVILYMWFTFSATEWRMTIRREMNDSDTEANIKAVDSLLNFETVKYFGNEEMEARLFDRSMKRYERAAVRTYYSLGILNTGQAIIFTVGMTSCMALTAHGVTMGNHTVGDLVMINALMIQLYIPLNFMGFAYRELRQGLVDLETVFALLEQHPEIKDLPNASDLEVRQGEIKFEHVTFSYDTERVVLKDLSFVCEPGSFVALVGPSGAGKSTISNILFRFYDITEGEVSIDGQNIANLQQKSLRSAIGIVPQNAVLFNDTIFYNIHYGRLDATDEEVCEAARLAQINDFIQQLPEGYNTVVGERGLKLSGGEKQRIAIARTILKAPPILILDEATSALDSQTEKDIQNALDEIAKGRTSLVIAHRLSTIIHADKILVLDNGYLIEEGTHAELVAADGLYTSLWNQQQNLNSKST